MSSRKVKRCQRRYNHGYGKSQMCGRLLSRMSESPYCPSCQGKIESEKKRKESVMVHGKEKIGYHDYGRKGECPNCGNKEAYVYIKAWTEYCMCEKCEGKEQK